MIITAEEYLKDERIEDVLVGYSIPLKAEERLKKLQEALYQTREESIRKKNRPILEGLLLFGSFTRGKPEPGDIDIVPFFDFSQYIPEQDSFGDLVKRSNQTSSLIEKLGKRYRKIGGSLQLGKLHFKEDDYCPQNYIDCTTDNSFSKDFSQLSSFFLNAGWCSYVEPRRRFKPRIEHVLGPKRLKEQFKRVTS